MQQKCGKEILYISAEMLFTYITK